MADCLNNEEQVTSNLDSKNQDSLNSNLDTGNSITSDIGTDGVLTSNMTSGESVSSVLNSDEALASKLDFPSSGEKYDDTELRKLITQLEKDKADKDDIPDVSNFVSRDVDDLTNYYTKSQTYTQEEVNDLIDNLEQTGGETSGLFMPVGSIFSSAIPQIDARVHLLDGSIISQTGIYADFAILLKTLVSSGYNITFSSNAEYENQIETYGQCGRFVIDDNAGTIRLPTITKFVEGLTDLTNIGKSFYAGLPNITGEWKAERSEVVTVLSTGAFSGTATYNSGSQPYYEKGNGGTYLKFNASSSNPIYGKSHTVQPQSTAYPYYIVLAGGYKSNEQVNIDEIATDVNLKADKTLSNVSYPQNIAGSTTTGSGDRVIESYLSSDGNSWYRKWASGWKECGLLSCIVAKNAYTSFTLPIEFKSYKYTVTGILSAGSANASSWSGKPPIIGSKTITGFSAKNDDSGGDDYFDLYICGY